MTHILVYSRAMIEHWLYSWVGLVAHFNPLLCNLGNVIHYLGQQMANQLDDVLWARLINWATISWIMINMSRTDAIHKTRLLQNILRIYGLLYSMNRWITCSYIFWQTHVIVHVILIWSHQGWTMSCHTYLRLYVIVVWLHTHRRNSIINVILVVI